MCVYVYVRARVPACACVYVRVCVRARVCACACLCDPYFLHNGFQSCVYADLSLNTDFPPLFWSPGFR